MADKNKPRGKEGHRSIVGKLYDQLTGQNNDPNQRNGNVFKPQIDDSRALLNKYHPQNIISEIENISGPEILQMAGNALKKTTAGILGAGSAAKNLVTGHPKTALVAGGGLAAYELAKHSAEKPTEKGIDTDHAAEQHIAKADDKTRHLSVVPDRKQELQAQYSEEKFENRRPLNLTASLDKAVDQNKTQAKEIADNKVIRPRAFMGPDQQFGQGGKSDINVKQKVA